MKKLFCILFCLSLLACSQESGERPDSLLPEETMVRILADIHVTEALIETNVVYPDTAQMVFNREKAAILEKYGVTQEEFKTTYDYYLNNLQAMDALYETVVDTLSVRESQVQANKKD